MRWPWNRKAAPTWPMCRDLMARLSDYLEGAVSDDERGAIDAHLAGCDGCTEAVEQFRVTIDAVGSLAVDDVASLDPQLRERLLGAFRAGRAEDR